MDDLQAIMMVYSLFALVCGLIYSIFALVGYYKIFDKAGFPGWLSLVPILNIIITFRIAKMSPWLFFLLIIPGVNIILLIVHTFKLAGAFGKSTSYAFMSIFIGPITIPLIGYTNAMYK